MFARGTGILSLQKFVDPAVGALFRKEMTWGEVNDLEDKTVPLNDAETITMMDRILALKQKKQEKVIAKRSIQWAEKNEVRVFVSDAAIQMPVVADDGFQMVKKVKASQAAQAVQASQASQASQVNLHRIRTIIARNLPRTITDLELRKHFGLHGAIQDIYIPKNNTPGKYFGTIKGFALIKYHTHHDSTKAFLAEQNGLFLGGNVVTLEFANQDR
jgi:hypothetical protein